MKRVSTPLSGNDLFKKSYFKKNEKELREKGKEDV